MCQVRFAIDLTKYDTIVPSKARFVIMLSTILRSAPSRICHNCVQNLTQVANQDSCDFVHDFWQTYDKSCLAHCVRILTNLWQIMLGTVWVLTKVEENQFGALCFSDQIGMMPIIMCHCLRIVQCAKQDLFFSRNSVTRRRARYVFFITNCTQCAQTQSVIILSKLLCSVPSQNFPFFYKNVLHDVHLMIF